MSSDGSYADIDEYSAGSSSLEWFWNDDVEPTQADELAEGTMPSPVWDEGQYYIQETREFYSDWEYYSDDYFDGKPPSTHGDNPSKTRLSEPALKTHNGDSTRRNSNKHRKHSAALDRFLSDSPHGHSFRGLVYRDPGYFGNGHDPNYRPDNLNYQPGKSDKFQLFYDWRHPSKTNLPTIPNSPDSNIKSPPTKKPVGAAPTEDATHDAPYSQPRALPRRSSDHPHPHPDILLRKPLPCILVTTAAKSSPIDGCLTLAITSHDLRQSDYPDMIEFPYQRHESEKADDGGFAIDGK